MSQNDNAHLVVPSSVNQQEANRTSLGTPRGAPRAKVTLVANCSGNATKRPDGDQSENSALLPWPCYLGPVTLALLPWPCYIGPVAVSDRARQPGIHGNDFNEPRHSQQYRCTILNKVVGSLVSREGARGTIRTAGQCPVAEDVAAPAHKSVDTNAVDDGPRHHDRRIGV
jgi:hypothetical protein